MQWSFCAKIVFLIMFVFLGGCALFDTEQVPVPAPAPIVKPVVPSIDTHQGKLAYIAEGNGHLYICSIASDNKLINCATTGSTRESTAPSWLPDNIAFHTIGQTKIAYVASNSNVFICNVSATNGLVDCHITGYDMNQRTMEWLPTDLKLHSESMGTFAYVTGVKSVYMCAIANDGSLVKCNSTGFSLAHRPMNWVTNGITFNQVNGHSYAYVAGSKRLYLCEIGENSNLINCHPTGTDSKMAKIQWHPSNISFSNQGTNYYAYVADPSRLYQCSIDPSGGIINCNITGPDKNNMHWLPNNIVFNIVGNKKYAYVVGVYNVFLCNVDQSGGLSECNVTGTSASGTNMQWNPNNMTIRE